MNLSTSKEENSARDSALLGISELEAIALSDLDFCVGGQRRRRIRRGQGCGAHLEEGSDVLMDSSSNCPLDAICLNLTIGPGDF